MKAVENFRRQWKNQRLGSFGIQDLLQVHACSKPLFEDAGPDTAQFGGGGLWPWLRGGEEGSEPFQGAEEEAGAAMTYEEQLFAAAKFDDNYARAKQEDNRDGSHPVVVEGLECNHAASELLVVDIASVASSPCATFGLFAAVVNRLAGSLPEHDRIRLLQVSALWAHDVHAQSSRRYFRTSKMRKFCPFMSFLFSCSRPSPFSLTRTPFTTRL